MTSREQRLRKVIPGADETLVLTLAGRPAAEVDIIIAALRQARRDERQHQASKRRQAKTDARQHHHYDQDELTARNARMLDSSAERAARGDLDALASLAAIARHTDHLTRQAVKKIRDRGDISDDLVGKALGITRQAVGQRFGRKGVFTPEDTTALAGCNPPL